MPEISTEGVTGMLPEFQKAFEKVVAAERRPVERILKEQERIDAQGHRLNEILGKASSLEQIVDQLSNPKGLHSLMVATSDEHILTAEIASDRAQPGTHQISVLRLAEPAAALSNGFADRDQTQIGTGYFTLENADGSSVEIFIDEANSTLEGVARLINSSGTDFRASVVRDDSDPEYPFRLVVSNRESGAGNSVNYPSLYLVGGDEDFYWESQRPATNALLNFQGFEIESPTNQIADLVEGISIQLRGINQDGGTGQIEITQNVPQIVDQVRGFVGSMNELVRTVHGENGKDAPKQNPNEYSFRLMENRLRAAFQSWPADAGSIRSIQDLGISLTREGGLAFDEKKLSRALTDHYNETVHFLAGDQNQGGFMDRIKSSLSTLTNSSSGLLKVQQSNLGTRSKQLSIQASKQQEMAEKKIEQLKEKLWKAQNAMQTIQQQSSSLAGMLTGGQGLHG